MADYLLSQPQKGKGTIRSARDWEIKSRAAESAGQDETAHMCSLILLYILR